MTNREILFILRAKNQTGRALKGMVGNLSKVAKAAKTVQTQLKGQTLEIKKSSEAMRRFGRGAPLKPLQKSVDRATRGFRTMGKQATVTRGLVGRLGRTLTQVFGVFTAGLILRSVVTTFAGFQRQMNIVRVISQATDAEFRDLTDTAKILGSTTEFTGRQAGAGLEFLVRAGFSSKQAIEAIIPVLDLATAANIGLAESADLVSNIMSTFAVETSEAARVSDTLAFVNSKTNTNVMQLAQAMKLGGTAAALFGVSLEETAAGIGVLGDFGIQATRAGTNIRQFLLKAKEIATGTAPRIALETLAALKIDPKDIDPGRVGLLGIVKVFAQLKAEGKDIPTILTRMFDARSVGGINAMITSFEKFERLVFSLGQTGGLAARQAATIRADLQGSFDSIRSAIEGAFIEIGTVVGPTLKIVVDFATAVIREWSGVEDITKGMSDAMKDLKPIIEGVAAAFKILLPILTALLIMKTVAFAAGVYGAAMRLAAADTTLLGRAINSVSFAGLVGGFRVAGGAALTFGKGMKTAAIGVGVASVGFTKGLVTRPIGTMVRFVKLLVTWMSRLGGAIRLAFTVLRPFLALLAANPLTAFIAALVITVGWLVAIRNRVSEVMGRTVTLSDVAAVMWGRITKAVQAVGKSLSNLLKDAVDTFSGMVKATVDWLSSLGLAMKAGINFGIAFLVTMKDAFILFFTAIAAIGKDFFESIFDPRKDFDPAKALIDQLDGFAQKAGENFGTDYVDAAGNAIQSGIVSIGTEIKRGAEALLGGILDAAEFRRKIRIRKARDAARRLDRGNGSGVVTTTEPEVIFTDFVAPNSAEADAFKTVLQGLQQQFAPFSAAVRALDANFVELAKAQRLSTAELNAMGVSREDLIKIEQGLLKAFTDEFDLVDQLATKYKEENALRGLLGESLFIETEIRNALNKAKKLGIDLSVQELDAIRELAKNQFNTNEADRRLEDLRGKIKDLNDEIATGIGDSIVEGLKTGKFAFDQFLFDIGGSFIQTGIDLIIGEITTALSSGGEGNFLGDLIGKIFPKVATPESSQADALNAPIDAIVQTANEFNTQFGMVMGEPGITGNTRQIGLTFAQNFQAALAQVTAGVQGAGGGGLDGLGAIGTGGGSTGGSGAPSTSPIPLPNPTRVLSNTLQDFNGQMKEALGSVSGGITTATQNILLGGSAVAGAAPSGGLFGGLFSGLSGIFGDFEGNFGSIGAGIVGGLGGLIGSLLSGGGSTSNILGSLGGIISGIGLSLLTAKDGGIIGPQGRVPLTKFADGGIATTPQLALFGEGSVPEAFVPVPSGRIPVEMRGSVGGIVQNTTVTMNITTPDANSFRNSKPQIASDMAREMQRQLARNG